MDGTVERRSGSVGRFAKSQVPAIFQGLYAESFYIPFHQIHLGELFAFGGSGQLYRGKWGKADVAVKALYSQMIMTEDLDDFAHEARMLVQLKHPHITAFYGISSHASVLYIVMEYCPCCLDDLVLSDEYTPAEFQRLALQLFTTISFLHSRDVAHRDLKPLNVLVDSAKNVKICDLGMATLNRSDGLSMTVGVGTPQFMPPELSRARRAVYDATK